MKQEKIKISIERNILRTNQQGDKINVIFPKAFGDKNNNDFITAEDDESILNIKTPLSFNISETYNKFEEIINVVYVELYNMDELIWPSNYENLDLCLKIKLSIDKEFYEEMKEVNKNLPNTIEDAYNLIENNSIINLDSLKSIYGNLKIKIEGNCIEIQNIHTNYLSKNGILEEDVMFITAYLFTCLENNREISAVELLKEMKRISKLYHLKLQNGIDSIGKELKLKQSRIEKENKLNSEEILDLAKKYSKEGYDTRYCLQKYKKLVSESVVLIKDSISQGIDYKVLNESKSIVEHNYRGHREFVIEGNKTNRDNYIFPIITDDKFTAKQIMKEAGLNVPNAILLEKDMDKEDIESLVSPFYNKTLVVKPRNTNYGLGITVFSKKATKKQILNAIEYAFTFDTNVLIEQYVKGMEYRFLVVNGECLSVAHRRTASVVGDGKSTIKELIEEKNKEPWHFLTLTPVKMDQPVVEFLKLQNYTFDSIIPKGKRVFLRTNSNCSTGGESIDMTEIMPNKFKKIAEKAANAFNGKICGVDIIIDDLEKDDYSIIEINDNPGYSINEWPYEGKGEKIGISILKLLDYTIN